MRVSAFHTRVSNAAPCMSSRRSPSSALIPAKYVSSHVRARAIGRDSRSTISCGGKWRCRRASRRVNGFSGPMNSSAHSPSSDASASMSPSGVETVARARIMTASSPCLLDEMPDDRLLLVDELPDAMVGEIEQRVQRLAPERDRFGRALHLDEPAVAGLDDVHVHFGAAVVV